MAPISRRAFVVGGATLVPAAGLAARPDDLPKPERRPPDQFIFNNTQFVVEGRVFTHDHNGGKPMPGVQVWASSGIGSLRRTGETTTDAEGKYRVTFGPGRHMASGKVKGLVAVLHAYKPGWYQLTTNLPSQFLLRDEPPGPGEKPPEGRGFLRGGEVGRVDFVMGHAAAVKVRLTDGAGQPRAGTKVWLTGDTLYPATNVIASGTTDAAGVWAASEIPCWRSRLVVGDPSDFHRELTVGQIHFQKAAEYTADVTLREWSDTATDVSFRLSRGRLLSP